MHVIAIATFRTTLKNSIPAGGLIKFGMLYSLLAELNDAIMRCQSYFGMPISDKDV